MNMKNMYWELLVMIELSAIGALSLVFNLGSLLLIGIGAFSCVGVGMVLVDVMGRYDSNCDARWGDDDEEG